MKHLKVHWIQLTHFFISFLSTICRPVGPVQCLGERNELYSRRFLLWPFLFLLLFTLLLPGCPLRTGQQPWQLAGPDAHEVQHAVLQLQWRSAKHHTHWWAWHVSWLIWCQLHGTTGDLWGAWWVLWCIFRETNLGFLFYFSYLSFFCFFAENSWICFM